MSDAICGNRGWKSRLALHGIEPSFDDVSAFPASRVFGSRRAPSNRGLGGGAGGRDEAVSRARGGGRGRLRPGARSKTARDSSRARGGGRGRLRPGTGLIGTEKSKSGRPVQCPSGNQVRPPGPIRPPGNQSPAVRYNVRPEIKSGRPAQFVRPEIKVRPPGSMSVRESSPATRPHSSAQKSKSGRPVL